MNVIMKAIDDNNNVLAHIESDDFESLPKTLMSFFALIGWPIESITFRLPAGGKWIGTYGGVG